MNELVKDVTIMLQCLLTDLKYLMRGYDQSATDYK